MSQLALPLRLQDHARFSTFWRAGNEQTVAFVEGLADEAAPAGGWLWGPAAVGKSHLLQATCERMGPSAAYLPLSDVSETGPGILEGLTDRSILCLDDLHCVTGQSEWELGLFSLFNAVGEAGGSILAASRAPQRDSGIELPDLESRLATLPTFQLRPLDEAGSVAALKLRAMHRGLELPDETARFLLSRARRDMASLYALLDRLDTEALVAKRRLTVPFVKSVLERD
ncbi:MAG: DnaA regulatory inactivator Hda [Pseudomonadota bacterium]